jgi:hypothetical protein
MWVALIFIALSAVVTVLTARSNPDLPSGTLPSYSNNSDSLYWLLLAACWALWNLWIFLCFVDHVGCKGLCPCNVGGSRQWRSKQNEESSTDMREETFPSSMRRWHLLYCSALCCSQRKALKCTSEHDKGKKSVGCKLQEWRLKKKLELVKKNLESAKKDLEGTKKMLVDAKQQEGKSRAAASQAAAPLQWCVVVVGAGAVGSAAGVGPPLKSAAELQKELEALQEELVKRQGVLETQQKELASTEKDLGALQKKMAHGRRIASGRILCSECEEVYSPVLEKAARGWCGAR